MNKISISKMFKLKREFEMTKTEREQIRILKSERQQDIKSYLTIVNLLLLAVILIYILYLMWTYKW